MRALATYYHKCGKTVMGCDKTEAMDLFQKRGDIENARVYTRDAFVIADEMPQISQGEDEEESPKMGM